MTDNHTKGEMHGCIVCGRLYELYVVYEPGGRFIDSMVLSAGGKRVPHPVRPLVACEHHTDDEIGRAVERVYGTRSLEDD